MARRYSRRNRGLPSPRAPRKGTLAVASFLYLVGLFGMLGFVAIPESYAVAALAIAGGLLILGALLRDL